MTLERRTAVLELRAAGKRLEGRAVTFGAVAQLPGFTEVFAPGAFAQSLADGRDVLALFDHDPTRLLARTKSGTLKLAEDERGLSFAFDVPDTQAGHDALALAQRGDLGGMSVGFKVPKGGDTWRGTRRELRAVNLVEISIVSAFPAYPETSVIARSAPKDVRLSLSRRLIAVYERTPR